MAPLILFTSGYYHQTLLQTRFRDAGLTPNVLFSSNQLLTIKSFVRQNLAGAFLLPQVIEPGENIIAGAGEKYPSPPGAPAVAAEHRGGMAAGRISYPGDPPVYSFYENPL